jgi:putative DNA primase/helicase
MYQQSHSNQSNQSFHQDSNKVYDGQPELTPVVDIKREEIEWIWPGRLPAGKLVMLAGDPGLGKSFLTMDIAARLSAGQPLPDDKDQTRVDWRTQQTPNPLRDVVILSAEDDPGDTIRPRLEDAGANLSRVHIMSGVRFGERSGAVRLDRDAAAIWKALRSFENPGLVIIDPITAYLGNTDANSNADVRSVLHKLSRIAQHMRVCILCVSHLNKSQQSKAQYRTMGSLAFTAAARLAWLIAKDPGNPDSRVMAPIKSNISGFVPGLKYKIVQREDTHGPTVEYDIDDKPITLEDLEATSGEDDQPGELDEAVSWLREALKGGAVAAKEVNQMAGEVGISKATLKRAKRVLGVRSKRIDGAADAGAWVWEI